MSAPPLHPDPKVHPPATDHPDNDPTYRSDVNWGSVKSVAESGVRVVYGGPYASRDPYNGPPRGIGIWKRNSPNYRSWDGLLELPLHLIVTRWVVSRVTFGLRLPIMGMPPREPNMVSINEARTGTQPFSDWFSYATVIPAKLFASFVKIDPKTATMELRGSWRDYNYSTASPKEDLERYDVSEREKSIDNLYYIQLLRNELPSYHFWSHTDPIGDSGQMRHGLIAKGATACYDIEGHDMISNVHINFNRLQNMPLRTMGSTGSEQIRNAYPNYRPPGRRNRSSSSRDPKPSTIYRMRARRSRPRTTCDASFKPLKGEGDELQEVRLNRRKRKLSDGGKVFKVDIAGKNKRRTTNGSEEED